MNSVRSIKLSLKYHRFTPSGFKVIGIEKFEFVTKTQFLFGYTMDHEDIILILGLSLL